MLLIGEGATLRAMVYMEFSLVVGTLNKPAGISGIGLLVELNQGSLLWYTYQPEESVVDQTTG